MQYAEPNSNNSYGIKCQSQMGFCGPLIFGMGVLLSTQVMKVNALSSTVHYTPEFLEIYQLYCSGATQYLSLALCLPLHPLPQCSFYCSSMTALAFPIVPLNNINTIVLQ